jgi:hypothetical protein
MMEIIMHIMQKSIMDISYKRFINYRRLEYQFKWPFFNKKIAPILWGRLYNSIHSFLEIHTSLIIFEIRPTHTSCPPCIGIGIISDHLVMCKCLPHVSGHSYHNFLNFSMTASGFNGTSLGIFYLVC